MRNMTKCAHVRAIRDVQLYTIINAHHGTTGCLHLAVDVLCKSDNPFNLVLRTTEELRSALIDPDMERIWENSRLGKSGMYEACQ